MAKMSKSLYVISPEDMVKRYARCNQISTDEPRTFGEDMDVTWDKLDVVYTVDLANDSAIWCHGC